MIESGVKGCGMTMPLVEALFKGRVPLCMSLDCEFDVIWMLQKLNCFPHEVRYIAEHTSFSSSVSPFVVCCIHYFHQKLDCLKRDDEG